MRRGEKREQEARSEPGGQESSIANLTGFYRDKKLAKVSGPIRGLKSLR